MNDDPAIYTVKDAARCWGVSVSSARRYLRIYHVRCRVFSRRMIQVHPGEIERVARAVEARWTWPDPPVVTREEVLPGKRCPASKGLKRPR